MAQDAETASNVLILNFTLRGTQESEYDELVLYVDYRSHISKILYELLPWYIIHPAN